MIVRTFPDSHQLYQAIHPGAVHRCPAIAVIYDFQKMINRKALATQILLDACTLRLNAAAFIYAMPSSTSPSSFDNLKYEISIRSSNLTHPLHTIRSSVIDLYGSLKLKAMVMLLVVMNQHFLYKLFQNFRC